MVLLLFRVTCVNLWPFPSPQISRLKKKNRPVWTDIPGVITGGTECYGGRYNLQPSGNLNY
jgi:hypothetical protein